MRIAKRVTRFTDRKKRGPRLGSGASEGAFRSQRRFHTGCVGSSILASLSEVLIRFENKRYKRIFNNLRSVLVGNNRQKTRSVNADYNAGFIKSQLFTP